MQFSQNRACSMGPLPCSWELVLGALILAPLRLLPVASCCFRFLPPRFRLHCGCFPLICLNFFRLCTRFLWWAWAKPGSANPLMNTGEARVDESVDEHGRWSPGRQILPIILPCVWGRCRYNVYSYQVFYLMCVSCNPLNPLQIHQKSYRKFLQKPSKNSSKNPRHIPNKNLENNLSGGVLPPAAW